MSAKSIVSIGVDDSQFQEFMDRFHEYQEALGDLPEGWRSVGAGIDGAADKMGGVADESDRMAHNFNEMIGSISVLRDSVDALNVNISKAAGSQGDLAKRSEQGANAMKRARIEAGGVAKHIRDATVRLLSWAGIVGVLGSMATGFGLNRLAMTGQAMQSSSSGNNTTSGALSSAAVNYAGVLDSPESALANINTLQNDVTQKWKLSAMGVDPSESDPAEALSQAIRGARDKFNQANGDLEFARNSGLTSVFTPQDLNRLKNMTDAEIDSMIRRERQDRRSLQVGEDQLKAWSELNRSLARSNVGLKNTLIDGLAPLAPVIGKLSEAFNVALRAFLESPVVGEIIDGLAQSLNGLANYLSKPAFKEDVQSFMTGVRDMYRGMKSFISWVSSLFGWSGSNNDSGGSGSGTTAGGGAGDASAKGGLNLTTNPDEFRTVNGTRGFWYKEPEPQSKKEKGGSGSWGIISEAGAATIEPSILSGDTGDKNRRVEYGSEPVSAPASSSEYGDLTGYKPLVKSDNAPTKYDSFIDESSKKYNVDPNVLKAIIEAESSWNEKAVNKKSGATGLGQLIPMNSEGIDPLNPQQNIDRSAKVLRWAYDYSKRNKDGSLDEALKTYNGGKYRGGPENNAYPGRVLAAMNRQLGGSVERRRSGGLSEEMQIAANQMKEQRPQSPQPASSQPIEKTPMELKEIAGILREIRDESRNRNGSMAISMGMSSGNAVDQSKLIGGFS